MVLMNTFTTDWHFNEKLAFQLCAMSATVFTPKFFALLDALQPPEFPKHLAECAAETKHRSRKYMHQVYSKPCTEEPASGSQTFRLAAKLYALYDDVLVSDGIQEKIQAWKAAYLAARQQFLQEAPYKVKVSDIPSVPFKHCEDVPLSEYYHGIAHELLDYSDELDSWLDLYFTDEYDPDAQSSLFDEIVQIIADLRAMADEVEVLYF